MRRGHLQGHAAAGRQEHLRHPCLEHRRPLAAQRLAHRPARHPPHARQDGLERLAVCGAVARRQHGAQREDELRCQRVHATRGVQHARGSHGETERRRSAGRLRADHPGPRSKGNRRAEHDLHARRAQRAQHRSQPLLPTERHLRRARLAEEDGQEAGGGRGRLEALPFALRLRRRPAAAAPSGSGGTREGRDDVQCGKGDLRRAVRHDTLAEGGGEGADHGVA